MILDLHKKRYSVRAFLGTAIPHSIIGYILECGRLSPSGGNEQPWKVENLTINAMADLRSFELNYLGG